VNVPSLSRGPDFCCRPTPPNGGRCDIQQKMDAIKVIVETHLDYPTRCLFSRNVFPIAKLQAHLKEEIDLIKSYSKTMLVDLFTNFRQYHSGNPPYPCLYILIIIVVIL
jgi:hypothetical protein